MCSKSGSSVSPHFWAQAPPGAQQLRLPVFSMVPHRGHAWAALVAISEVTAVVAMLVTDTTVVVVAGGNMLGGGNEE